MNLKAFLISTLCICTSLAANSQVLNEYKVKYTDIHAKVYTWQFPEFRGYSLGLDYCGNSNTVGDFTNHIGHGASGSVLLAGGHIIEGAVGIASNEGLGYDNGYQPYGRVNAQVTIWQRTKTNKRRVGYFHYAKNPKLKVMKHMELVVPVPVTYMRQISFGAKYEPAYTGHAHPVFHLGLIRSKGYAAQAVLEDEAFGAGAGIIGNALRILYVHSPYAKGIGVELAIQNRGFVIRNPAVKYKSWLNWLGTTNAELFISALPAYDFDGDGYSFPALSTGFRASIFCLGGVRSK